MLYTATGILRYSIGDAGFRLVLDIDQNINNFYRSLIPKYFYARPQKHPAHISIVRKETPNSTLWNKHKGKEIEFAYDSQIHYDNVYFWLNVFSTQLEEIRLELGLPVSSKYTLPPSGFTRCFHTTIGNRK